MLFRFLIQVATFHVKTDVKTYIVNRPGANKLMTIKYLIFGSFTHHSKNSGPYAVTQIVHAIKAFIRNSTRGISRRIRN